MNPRSWQDVQLELAADPEAERVDMDYFRGLIAAIAPNRAALDTQARRVVRDSAA